MSVEVPREFYKRLLAVAARRGCSVEQLILESVEHVVVEDSETRQSSRLSLDQPIVGTRGGGPFDLTAEEIHELIEFP